MENKSETNRLNNASVNPTIDATQIASYNKQRLQKNATTLCFAPSVNLYFGRDGKVLCCCHNRDYFVGEYPHNSIDEIWNGNKINTLRKHLSGYNLSLGCQHCQKDMDRCSYAQVAATHFDELSQNAAYPTMMEFELDSTCNLECSMCNGDLSSAIRKNRDHLPPIKSKYDDAFVAQLKPYLPHLQETRFSGGEPFLIPIYYKIWDALTEANLQCLISVQTNGTILNNKVKAIMEKGRFEIGVSLDSIVKQTFEEIRTNAKFENVMENIHYFSKYCKKKETAFRLSICVMRNNWKDLPQYIELCNRLGAYASFHKVIVPANLSLYSWKSEELKKVHDYLAQFVPVSENNLEQTNANHYHDYVQLIGKWQKDRKNYEQQKQANENVTLPALILQLRKAMTTYADTTEYDTKESVNTIETHVKEVMKNLTEQKKKALIHQLLYYDAATVFNKFLLSDVGKLRVEMMAHIPS